MEIDVGLCGQPVANREKLRMDEAARIANAVQKAREEVLRGAEDNAQVAESKGKLETARNALSRNLSVEDVMAITGIPRSEIENLR
ncbi:hypothetical protein FACS189454_09880 [Planctomycetales bacterium]|nr:hypothetical protein FACS189454_09880 [Planctomycetales bacterium]